MIKIIFKMKRMLKYFFTYFYFHKNIECFIIVLFQDKFITKTFSFKSEIVYKIFNFKKYKLNFINIFYFNKTLI